MFLAASTPVLLLRSHFLSRVCSVFLPMLTNIGRNTPRACPGFAPKMDLLVLFLGLHFPSVTPSQAVFTEVFRPSPLPHSPRGLTWFLPSYSRGPLPLAEWRSLSSLPPLGYQCYKLIASTVLLTSTVCTIPLPSPLATLFPIRISQGVAEKVLPPRVRMFLLSLGVLPTFGLVTRTPHLSTAAATSPWSVRSSPILGQWWLAVLEVGRLFDLFTLHA